MAWVCISASGIGSLGFIDVTADRSSWIYSKVYKAIQ